MLFIQISAFVIAIRQLTEKQPRRQVAVMYIDEVASSLHSSQ